MPRFFVAAAATALILGASAPALADKAPDAAQVRQAAEQFDAGVTAYKNKDFEGAASRFEAADAAVPGAKTLRQAIRARMEAGHGSRAATLAAQAIERYPDDEATLKLAKETIAKVEPLVQRLNVSCSTPCVLAIGTRSVPGESSTRWTVYVDPGKTAMGASFFGGASSRQQDITAAAGKSTDVRFEPEEKAKPVVVPVPTSTAPAVETPPVDAPVTPPAKASSGIHPAAFIVGAVATVGLGAVTIWSGIDTKTNPGPDAVKMQCAGQGPTCPAYEEGRKKQTRTNIFIGATAGTAAVTVVLAILTSWHGKKKAAGPTAEPTATLTDHGAVLGAVGTF